MIFAIKNKIWYYVIYSKTYLINMWEIIKDIKQNQIQNGWELLQSINKGIEDSQVDQEIRKRYNVFVRKFPYLFMSPGELIEYFEWLRNEIEWITAFDESKALNDQIVANDFTATKKAA